MRSEALIQEVRSSAAVLVHRKNVEALVLPVDPEVLKRAMQEPEKK
jgi:hypothetical protein